MLIMSNGFTDSELRTIKMALNYWFKSSPTFKYINTKHEKELIRKVRLMLGEGEQIAEEDRKEIGQSILDKVLDKYKSHEIEV